MLSGYIGKMRALIGHTKLIHPATRIIIEDPQGRYLFIRRGDNGNLGLPAGGMEEGESVRECIIREVREETGLELLDCEVIGISTNPALETAFYGNGDETQYFAVEFYSRQYTGQLRADGIESTEVAFRTSSAISQLPANERSTFDSLEHYRKTGKIRLA